MAVCARFRCRIVQAIALIAAAAAGAGCASANLATRFYVLTPSAPAGMAAPPPASGRDVTVGVGPIVLPTYLDRPQIVVRTGQDEIELAEFDLWAEPLQSAVPRVVAENLAAGIPTHHVVVFPWRGRGIVQYQVAVDILRFEATAAGDAMLRARWRLLDADGQELAIRTVALTERTERSGYGTIVAALSRLLGALSAEISDAIVTASRDSTGTSSAPFRRSRPPHRGSSVLLPP